MALGERPLKNAVIDAVSEVVDSTPRQAFPTVETRVGGIARLFRSAKGLRVRDRTVPGELVDTISLPQTSSGFSIHKVSFALCVILPAILGAIYFAAIASDQFVAEMRFVVRFGTQDTSPTTSAAGGASALLGGIAKATGSSSSTEDAYIVTSYIHSRTMVDDLSARVDLRQIYRRPEADLVARLKETASVDELRKYWSKMVGTSIESTSGIVTVQIRAFRPEDAVLLATHVEQLAERLVNDISTRARTDALRRANEEVERTQKMMYDALRDMERYRNTEGLIDPIQTATETGKLLTGVLTDQLSAENQLFVARQSLGPESPSVRTLQTRVESLRQQVVRLRQQIAGNTSESRNVAAALARYEEVAVKQKMAEGLYTLAANGLDRARRTAESQSLYLTTFVPPRLPEDNVYPKRIFNPIAIAICCLVFWSIVVLICASVEDHRLA